MITFFKAIKINERRFNKIEPILFLLLCLIGILPLLFSKYYVTLDGPAHLYNANLIKALVLGNHSEISNLFVINSFPIPNWSGHFIMALFNLILPAFLSEKIVFLLYFILTPIFFRKFVLQFYPENKAFTYFILLFVHNHMIYFGFINMSIGIMFMFITGFYYSKYCTNIKILNIFVLSLLLLVVFFSHVLIFLISLLILVVVVLLKLQIVDNNTKILNIKDIGNRTMILFIAALPGIILTIIYLLSIDSIEKGVRPDLTLLFNYIIDIRPLLTLCYSDSWSNLTHILISFFGILILSNIYLLIKNKISYKKGQLFIKMPLKTSSLWFAVWFVFLLLFLILPNSILLTERLILLFYLFFIIWLASLKYPKILNIICLIVVIFLHISFVNKHFDPMRAISKDAEKIVSVSKKIKENSIVLTLNYSDNWLHSHISGYLGCNKPIAILENYEAALKWFPIQWNNEVYRIDKLNSWGVNNKVIASEYYIDERDTTCFSLRYVNNHIKPIPYVLILGKFIESNNVIKDILKNHYNVIGNNDFCTLYKLKTVN